MALVLSSEHREAVRDHVTRAYPHEACGILLGTGAVVSAVIGCTNEITDRSDRYRIPAAELIAAQKRARATGTDILGFYHSHPDHVPEPSTTDLAEAHWFGCVYMIVSVDKGTAREMRAFRLEGEEPHKRFSELTIIS